MFYLSIPEVQTRRDGPGGDTDVQTIKAILWVAGRRTLVQVTVPLDQNGNRTSLQKPTSELQTLHKSSKATSQRVFVWKYKSEVVRTEELMSWNL